MKKISVFSAIFLFLAVLSGWAQMYEAPHVTQIKAEVRNNLIRLTWVDSPEARGPVYVFRSSRPFTTAIPQNVRPVIIRYGAGFFIDDIDDMDNLYYFIAASDTAGRRYDVIMPQINYAYINLAPSSETDGTYEPYLAEDAASLPVVTLTSAPPIQGISNLRAVVNEEKVTISFTNSNPERRTLLYRSMLPVRSPQDLINAVIVVPGSDSQFTDYPVPGTAWYYAVIYEDEVSRGNIEIKPGVNATTASVIVSSDLTSGRLMRPIPLPELTLREINRDFFLTNEPIKMPLSAESANMLENIPISQGKPFELRNPRVFVMDLQSPATGEESALFQIIKDYFEVFDWENVRTRFGHFLSLPRSWEVEARARFYLGQSLYFTGNYREALMEFLLFRSYHSAEANIWIDAVLTAMINSGQAF